MSLHLHLSQQTEERRLPLDPWQGEGRMSEDPRRLTSNQKRSNDANIFHGLCKTGLQQFKTVFTVLTKKDCNVKKQKTPRPSRLNLLLGY